MRKLLFFFFLISTITLQASKELDTKEEIQELSKLSGCGDNLSLNLKLPSLEKPKMVAEKMIDFASDTLSKSSGNHVNAGGPGLLEVGFVGLLGYSVVWGGLGQGR